MPKFNNKAQEARYEAGLCFLCGRIRDNNTSKCNVCAQKQKDYYTNRGLLRKEQGLCARCGMEPEPPFATCLSCREDVERRKSDTSIPVNRIRSLVTAAKSRAKKSGIEIDSDLYEHIILSTLVICPCCGIQLDYSIDRGLGIGINRLSHSPSLDRVDSSKGYTKVNTRIICTRCNLLKGDATLEELHNIVHYVENQSVGY